MRNMAASEMMSTVKMKITTVSDAPYELSSSRRTIPIRKQLINIGNERQITIIRSLIRTSKCQHYCIEARCQCCDGKS